MVVVGGCVVVVVGSMTASVGLADTAAVTGSVRTSRACGLGALSTSAARMTTARTRRKRDIITDLQNNESGHEFGDPSRGV